MTIERYKPEMAQEWDGMVEQSLCGTILLYRRYMDYHSDRFTDASLMARDERDGRLSGVLPANRVGSTLYSHQGLTFGGWVTPLRHVAPQRMLDLWQAAVDFLKEDGVEEIIYKPRPWIYSPYPAEDDLYGLYRMGGQLRSMQIAQTIPLDQPLLLNNDAKKHLKAAAKAGITVGEAKDFDLDIKTFWEMLDACLAERHEARPVHTVEEMTRLHTLFPKEIQLFMAWSKDGEPLAGTVVYRNLQVAHSQYIATTSEGRRVYALWPLLREVMEKHCQGMRYFDLGTSCEEAGRVLNAGLSAQKYSLGGRGVAYAAYGAELREGKLREGKLREGKLREGIKS
ncbi:MAG: GNAT family N-acetyltransferase [Bacteroidales bacterium]|nr:GNAT family N-acetyltransferase [Bacteroidales bacterium]